MEKRTSERASDFKKKNNGIDRRNMRAHRRSVEWKQMRDQTVNLKRDLGNPLSPLQENHQNVETPNPTKPVQKKLTAAESRREMLVKWRKEKELKKKIDSQEKAKKKPFKVAHIEPENIPFKKANNQLGKQKSQPSQVIKPDLRTRQIPLKEKAAVKVNTAVDHKKTKPATVKRPVPSPKKTETRRVTRSQIASKAVEKKPTGVNKATVSKPTTRNTGRLTKPDNIRAKVTEFKKAATKATGKKQEPKGKVEVNEVKSNKLMDSVRKTRGDRMSSNDFSFAPADFKFTAPSRLQSFTFQPLSPGSAASFLFPSKDLSVFSPPSSRRCSTPKLVSNNPSRIKQSPHASAIQELTSGSSESDTEKTRPAKAKSPVMSLVKAESLSLKGQQSTVDKVCNDNQHDITVVERKCESMMDTANGSKKSTQNSRRKSTKPKVENEEAEKEAPCKGDDTVEQMEIPGQNDIPNKPVPTEEPVEESQKNRKSVGKCVDPFKEGSGKPALKQTASLPEELLCGIRLPTDNTENVAPSDDHVFATPSGTAPRPRRNRTRSLGTALLLSNSAKRFRTPKNNRNSLILRTLSPEEGIEVLKHSPMVELTRRTPKSLNKDKKGVRPVDPLPTFDDIEEELKLAESPSRTKLDTSQSANTQVEATEKAAKENMCSDAAKCSLAADSSAPIPTNALEQEEKHDVSYFRKLLVIETSKLNEHCDKWETYNKGTQDLSEEDRGHIRTAIGKAQLLIAQRFKQFLGLVDDCDYKRGEKETTCQDLQGFWDMVYFQVEDVYNMFADLDKRKENNWQEAKPVVEKKKIVKKKPAAGKAKPAVKSKFAAFRAKMKQEQKPEDKETDEVKSFEGGFFNVNSPVKTSITVHCEGGTPSKLRMNTINRLKTPSGNSLLKAVVERAARKSLSCELFMDTPAHKSPSPWALTESGSKRKRTPTGNQDSPAKVAKLEEQPPAVKGNSLFTPETEKKSRRSLRRSLRKSVTWSKSEMNPSESSPTVKDQTTNFSFSKFLVPTEKEESHAQSDMDVDHLVSPLDDVDMAAASKRALHSEFDRHSNSAKKKSAMKRQSIATPGSIRRLSSSSRSASGRRKSRRSVHFSCKSPPSAEKSLKMPVTPFNHDSMVARQRRSSHNQSDIDCILFTPPVKTLKVEKATSSSGSTESPATRMSKLTMDSTPKDTPKERRRSTRTRRISGFTPPPKNKSPVAKLPVLKEDKSPALIDLMSFSPLPSNSSSSNSNTPRRSRRSTRQSLL